MNSSASLVANPRTSPTLVFEPDAVEFCQKNDLLSLVQLAADIAARNNALSGPIQVELETDPDANDAQRPILMAPIIATVDQARRQWVALAPHGLGLSLCLLTHIVGDGDATA